MYHHWNRLGETVLMRNYNACFMVIYVKPYQNYPLSLSYLGHCTEPGRVAQSIGHLTRKSEVLGSIPGLATCFISPSADLRGAVVSYWRNYVHEVLVPSRHDLRCLP